MNLICQSKSAIWTDKWLKGFQNWSTYARDIASQSCNTNCGTPCMTCTSPSVSEVGNLKIWEISFYCSFGMKCILTSLTFHILTLGSVLIEQGGYICYLVSSGAQNSEADLIYSFANILTKSKRYIDYIVFIKLEAWYNKYLPSLLTIYCWRSLHMVNGRKAFMICIFCEWSPIRRSSILPFQ